MSKDRFFTYAASRMYKAALIIGTLIIIVFSCEKKEVDPPRVFPRVLTGAVTGVTEEGAEVHGEIVLQGSEPVIERGFVWHFNDWIPKLENADFITLSPSPDNPAFSYKIRSTLYKDRTYNVRAFARTASHTVYGNLVTFKSQGSRGPEMTGFSPKSGTKGDTVRIYGRYFGNKSIRITDRGTSNIVTFDEKIVYPVSWSDSVIVVTVPANLPKNQVKITVTVAGKSTTVDEYFLRIGAEITDFNPKTGYPGDTVKITGKLFSNINGENVVKFNDLIAPVITSDTNLIVALVPLELRSPTSIISVKADNLLVTASDTFRLKIPKIEDILPRTARIGDTLLVKGENFRAKIEDNEVLIDNASASLIEATDTTISLVVPKHPYNNVDMTKQKSPSGLYVKTKGLKSDESYLFTYLIPFVDFLTPSKVLPRDTMQIHGKNFTRFDKELKIQFNDYYGTESEIIKVTNDEITFIVPDDASGDTDIWIFTKEYETRLKNMFSYYAPQVSGISPDTVTFGDTVTITGNYFNPVKSRNRINIQYERAKIVDIQEQEIKVIVSPGVYTQTGNMFLSVNNFYQRIQINNALKLRKPEIYSFAPQVIYDVPAQIKISGKWFNPQINLNKVFFHGEQMNIINANTNEITFEVEIPQYISSQFSDIIRVECGGQQVTSLDSLTVNYNSLWTRINDFPDAARQGAAFITIGSKGYMIGGSLAGYSQTPVLTKEVWEFTTGNGGQWIRKQDFPGVLRREMISFTDGNYAYIGMGKSRKDIWRYDPAMDSWQYVTDFPGNPRLYPLVFVLNGKAYIGLGTLGNKESKNFHDLWEYDIATNSWSQKDSITFFKNHVDIKALGATLNNKGYISVYSFDQVSENQLKYKRTFLLYDQINDDWIQLSIDPGERGTHVIMNNRWYRFTNHMASFNPDNNSWASMPHYSRVRYAGIAFAIDGKIYYGIGSNYNQNALPLKEMWMIDPTKYP